jgi:type IV secretion system protein VirB1
MFWRAGVSRDCGAFRAGRRVCRLLNALVMHESRGNPLAIGVNGGFRLPRQPKDRAEAVATARWLASNGYNFDGGLGQVNVKNLGVLGMSVDDLFDPCANLRGASRILADCYGRASKVRVAGPAVLRAALSCYNTGDYSRGERNGYVGKIAGQLGQPVLKVPTLALGPAQPPVRQSEAIVASASAYGAGQTDMGAAPAPGPRDAFSAWEGDAFSRPSGRAVESIDDK